MEEAGLRVEAYQADLVNKQKEIDPWNQKIQRLKEKRETQKY